MDTLTTPAPVISPVPVQQSANHIRWWLIGAIFIAALFAGFEAYYFINKSIPEAVIPAFTPRPTVDPTAGWKTYWNRQYGFEIRYPSEYGDFNHTAPAKRSASIYLEKSYATDIAYVKYRDSVTAQFSVWSSGGGVFDPGPISIHVFELDDYRFISDSAGIERGYDKMTDTWWQNNGENKQVITSRVFEKNGWAAHQFKDGDAGASFVEWAILNRQAGFVVAVGFNTSESAMPIEKTFSIDSILS